MAMVVAGELVMPGDVVDQVSDVSLIGPSLRVCGEDVLALRCGAVVRRQAGVWLHSFERRYVPAVGDTVIGQVVQSTSDGWKVEIGCAMLANLSYFAFEGATKRNRPDLKLGDLVYARVAETVEPQLACVDPLGKAQGLGALPAGGILGRYSPGVSRKLLSRHCTLLQQVGKEIPFEITCGLNGWIWLKGRNIEDMIALLKLLQLVEHYPDSGCSVPDLLKALRDL